MRSHLVSPSSAARFARQTGGSQREEGRESSLSLGAAGDRDSGGSARERAAARARSPFRGRRCRVGGRDGRSAADEGPGIRGRRWARKINSQRHGRLIARRALVTEAGNKHCHDHDALARAYGLLDMCGDVRILRYLYFTAVFLRGTLELHASAFSSQRKHVELNVRRSHTTQPEQNYKMPSWFS